MNINQYAVYQLKESAELAAYRSRSYQYLTEHHFQVIVQNYQQAYFTKLFTSDTPEIIRKRLEEHRPKNFRGRPFGVGDVIVINQQGEITAYFVDKDSLVVVAGFIRSSSSGILVTLDTKNLFIDGCAGTWVATEECVVESQHFFLMQHEVYKEKAPNVIVDASGKLVSTEIRKGLDEDARKKILDYLHVKRKEGQFIGSFAGYGYRKDPKDKNHLIIDEYAAGIVQEIFKSKLNGMSSQRIASHLNELGVLPPNEYKRANGFNYTCGFQAGLNQKWTVVSVNRILKNESYTGTLIQGKRRKINYKVKKSHDVGSENWIRVEDAHDAIISKGEFQQVQQLLELDTRTAPSQTTVYPLSGFLRCADCGQNMIRRTVTKNGKKYQYYHCSTYKNGGGCTPHMINSEKLTESVLAAIRHQVTLLVEAEKVLSNAELASGEQIGIKILDSQITALEAELERYSNLKIRLYQDLCDDVVSREEYGEMNTRFAQKIKEAQDKIQEIREKKQEALKHDTLLPTWLEEFKQYEHIKTLERRVVVELIDHIDVHSKTEIEIHFCFEDELHSITEKFMEYQAHHGNEVAEE